jgi:hypothetical protein
MPSTGGAYRDRECCASVIYASGDPGTVRFRGRLSLKNEASLPLPRQLGFGRRLNSNPGVSPIRFFVVENTIKSNRPVAGWIGKAGGANSGAVSTANGPAPGNHPAGGDIVDGAPRVVIVGGGGGGGLAAVKALRHSPVHVTLIERTNHHLFQSLLYKVANQAAACCQRTGNGTVLPRLGVSLQDSSSYGVFRNGVT